MIALPECRRRCSWRRHLSRALSFKHSERRLIRVLWCRSLSALIRPDSSPAASARFPMASLAAYHGISLTVCTLAWKPSFLWDSKKLYGTFGYQPNKFWRLRKRQKSIFENLNSGFCHRLHQTETSEAEILFKHPKLLLDSSKPGFLNENRNFPENKFRIHTEKQIHFCNISKCKNQETIYQENLKYTKSTQNYFILK